MAARRQVVGVEPIERLAASVPIESRAPQPDPRRVFQIVLEHDLVEVLQQLLRGTSRRWPNVLLIQLAGTAVPKPKRAASFPRARPAPGTTWPRLSTTFTVRSALRCCSIRWLASVNHCWAVAGCSPRPVARHVTTSPLARRQALREASPRAPSGSRLWLTAWHMVIPSKSFCGPGTSAAPPCEPKAA